MSRRDLARLVPAKRNPLGILERQNSARLQDVVPLRIERMSASPFAFYRGTAAIMAADQATDPHSGILVASCGDAHLSNQVKEAGRSVLEEFGGIPQPPKVLARAHSQSPRFRDVVDYIGKGRRIADSLLTWGYEYAEVSRGDYEAFLAVHRDEG